MYLSTEQKNLFSAPDASTGTQPRVTTLLEKGSGGICEDTVLTAKNIYGVFDGATSLVPNRYDGGLTGGKIASSLCLDVFASETGNLEKVAEEANRLLAARAQAAGVDYSCREELWSCSAAVVKLESDHLQWCRIGDCQVVLLYRDGNVASVGSTADHDAETLLAWQQRASRCDGSIMEVMADEIADVRRRMNIDYGVFNGEPVALDFLQAGILPFEGVEHILLFTDGLMMPRRNPSAPHELELLARLYKKKGLSGIRDHVRSLQLQDLSCTLYPRFKIHDDIGAVALDLSF